MLVAFLWAFAAACNTAFAATKIHNGENPSFNVGMAAFFGIGAIILAINSRKV